MEELGTGVPLATGVLAAGSPGFSPFELGGSAIAFGVAVEDSFEGLSSLTSALITATANFRSFSGDSFNVIIWLSLTSCFRFDFRRAVAAVLFGTEGIVDLRMLRIKGILTLMAGCQRCALLNCSRWMKCQMAMCRLIY